MAQQHCVYLLKAVTVTASWTSSELLLMPRPERCLFPSGNVKGFLG